MHILRRMSTHLKAISLGSMALAAVGAIGWGVWHFRESRTMNTDDCRVEASIISVGSKLAERVTSVDVEEGETVRRGQTLAQMALAWVLRDQGDASVTTVLIGASSTAQLDDNLGALGTLEFSAEELAAIDEHGGVEGINLWQGATDSVK